MPHAVHSIRQTAQSPEFLIESTFEAAANAVGVWPGNATKSGNQETEGR
jgi:hypothetical protein